MYHVAVGWNILRVQFWCDVVRASLPYCIVYLFSYP